jgi:hypothetical protein
MDRFTFAVVGGVLALVAAGLVTAASLRGQVGSAPDLNTPAGVALAYAAAEQRGDAQAAWDLLATSAQQRGDRERFLARAGHSQPDNAYLSTDEERVDGDTASVTLVETYPGSGGLLGRATYTNRVTIRLARESAGWRITVPPDDFLLVSPKS